MEQSDKSTVPLPRFNNSLYFIDLFFFSCTASVMIIMPTPAKSTTNHQIKPLLSPVFGLFTDVSYQTKQSMKNVLGHLAYVLEGAKRLFNIPSYKVKVTHDDEVIEDEFVYGMVTNSRSVGGFRNLIGKQVGFDDGVFEVTLIKTPKNPIELQEIIAALMIEQMDSKYMYTFKSGRIMFESIEEIPWTLDGEFGGEHDEVVVENLNKELQIMVPGTHEED